MKIDFFLNGQLRSIDVDPRETLLDVLREYLDSRGTKYGCGEGECGACSVLLDGKPVTSCLVLAGQVHGREIITIEGMENDAIGQHIVPAFVDLGAVQCGYCIPGMIISTRALLSAESSPTLDQIQHHLGGNLCRCTGYKKIIAAVQSAGEAVTSQNVPSNGNKKSDRAYRSADFVHPGSLEEALALLSSSDGWVVVSGCTDFGVPNEHRLKDYQLLDLSGLEEITGIAEDEQFVHIRGGTTFSAISGSPLIDKWAHSLSQAAQMVGAVQIQNMGTLAGNLVNASPAADTVPPLFVLGASVVLRSTHCERIVPIEDFITGPGTTTIEKDEILVEVLVPKKTAVGEEITFFTKFGSRNAQTISIASLAMRGWFIQGQLEDVQIAMGAVAPTVIPALESAHQLMGGALTEERIIAAGNLAATACKPIDDIRATAVYRRQLVYGLLVKNLWEFAQ